MSIHMSHCTPCHLPNIDGTIDPRLVEEIESTVCEVCQTDDREELLLLCDICASGYHTYCLQPPLESVPEGTWLCPMCVKGGYTEADATARAQQREDAQLKASRPNLYPDSATKKRDEAAAAFDGRLVLQPFKDPATGRARRYWGRVEYRGPLFRPQYFLVTYQDGDSQTMTLARLKRWLQPEGTQLPAEVTIPASQVAMMAPASSSASMQYNYAASYGREAVIPAVTVPREDLVRLCQVFQFSLAQALCDPITHNPQWQSALGAGMKVTFDKPTHGATVILMAPIQSAAVSAIHRACAMKAACVVCYLPSLTMPEALGQLMSAMTARDTATYFRVTCGWWLIISQTKAKHPFVAELKAAGRCWLWPPYIQCPLSVQHPVLWILLLCFELSIQLKLFILLCVLPPVLYGTVADHDNLKSFCCASCLCLCRVTTTTGVPCTCIRIHSGSISSI